MTDHPISDAFAATYSFGLDDFQRRGCEELEAGNGVLVAAPTGAGKTVVGEFAVHLALQQGRKCFYTTPIKALSNQKYADLVTRHGADNVGLLTGDTTINGEAPVVVMTTEVLRNMLYAGSRTLLGLGYVVMDEVHYLADRSRGAVWEEVIIHLPESVAVVSLSATVSNAEEFGEWLAEVRGATTTIVAEKRPVPLFQHVMAGRKLHDLFASSDVDAAAGFVREDAPVNEDLLKLARDDWAASRLRDRRAPKGQRGRKGGRGQQGRRNVGNGRRVWIPGRIDVIDRLERDGLLPAIVFIFSRAGCDGAVQQCLDANLRLTTAAERDEAIEYVESTVGRLPGADLEVLGYESFLDATSRGMAAHHAGMLPAFKKCVEELYLRGLVKVVFATETLALGINMPARTVVLEKLSKWNGETHADITPGEYTQLTGRAGRRGLDVEGHAVVLWQPGMNPREVAGLASTRTYPLKSSFRPSYNMAVNLVDQYGRHRARELLEQSFAQFQADRAVVGLARRLHKAEEALDGYAEAAECHLGDFMEYAAMRNEVSELEKRGRRQRDTRGKKQGPPGNTHQAEIAKLRRRMKQHPCHACEEREDHARWAERWFRLQKDVQTLSRRIDRRTNTVARQFDHVCDVLTALQYLDGDHVTERGQGLKRIYSELDLVAAEALRTGLWEDLSPAQLVSVLSVLVYEARRPDDQEPRVPGGAVIDRIQELDRLSRELSRLERDHRLDFLRPPDAGFAWTAYRWAEGDDVDDLLRRGRLTAGDFVRQMKQLVDFTGQVADAAGAGPVREAARDAIGLIRRGIVAAE